MSELMARTEGAEDPILLPDADPISISSLNLLSSPSTPVEDDGEETSNDFLPPTPPPPSITDGFLAPLLHHPFLFLSTLEHLPIRTLRTLSHTSKLVRSWTLPHLTSTFLQLTIPLYASALPWQLKAENWVATVVKKGWEERCETFGLEGRGRGRVRNLRIVIERQEGDERWNFWRGTTEDGPPLSEAALQGEMEGSQLLERYGEKTDWEDEDLSLSMLLKNVKTVEIIAPPARTGFVKPSMDPTTEIASWLPGIEGMINALPLQTQVSFENFFGRHTRLVSFTLGRQNLVEGTVVRGLIKHTIAFRYDIMPPDIDSRIVQVRARWRESERGEYGTVDLMGPEWTPEGVLHDEGPTIEAEEPEIIEMRRRERMLRKFYRTLDLGAWKHANVITDDTDDPIERRSFLHFPLFTEEHLSHFTRAPEVPFNMNLQVLVLEGVSIPAVFDSSGTHLLAVFIAQQVGLTHVTFRNSLLCSRAGTGPDGPFLEWEPALLLPLSYRDDDLEYVSLRGLFSEPLGEKNGYDEYRAWERAILKATGLEKEDWGERGSETEWDMWRELVEEETR